MYIVYVAQTSSSLSDSEHTSTLPIDNSTCYLRGIGKISKPQVSLTLHGDETRCGNAYVDRTENTHYTSHSDYGGVQEEEKTEELLFRSTCSHGNLNFPGTHRCLQDEEEEKEEEEWIDRNNGDRPCEQDDREAALTIIASLKTCTREKNLLNGSKIHADTITRWLLETNVFVGSAIVNMYAKCGSLSKAQEAFDTLKVRNVVSWNVLIAGYVQHRHGYEALFCFEQMQLEGVTPNAVTFVGILKACNITDAKGKGQVIHAQIVKEGLLENDVVVGTALVEFYARLGLLEKAQDIFDKIVNPNVVTWTALIGGYAYNGFYKEPLVCYEQMQAGGLSPSAVTMVCILTACASIGALEMGQEIHSQIVRDGLLASDMYVATALIDMYAKCGALMKAEEICNELPFRDVAMVNALISGFIEHKHGQKALQCFEQMQLEGLSPDRVTLACVLKACGSLGNIEMGQELHIQIITQGWLDNDNFVGAALVDMYARCGVLEKAQEVFDQLPVQDIVSWNTLIAGYAEHGHGEKALKCYEKSCNQGLSPDEITYICILNACGIIGTAQKGEEIHADIVKHGLRAEDAVASNSLMDMYYKCGLPERAQILFNNLLVRDLVSWNTLIGGFFYYEQLEESINYFHLMQEDDLSPNLVTFVCVLKACGSMGTADKGQQIHSQILAYGLLESDRMIGTSLVDMYANCGMLAEAQEIFDKLSEQTIITWNALISAYTQVGDATLVFNYFNQMVKGGPRPDVVTFTILLNLCSHTGLLDMGQVYFEIMCTCYGLTPYLEHYTCMVDLLSRAGHIEKAVAVIKGMPFSASPMIWHTVLRACRKSKVVKLGELAFEYAAQLDEMDAAAYTGLKNVYVDAGRQEDTCTCETRREEAKGLHLGCCG